MPATRPQPTRPRPVRPALLGLTAVTALALVGCSAEGAPSPAPPPAPAPSSAAPTSASPTPPPTPTPTPSPTPTLPEVRAEEGLPAYMAEELDRDLTLTREGLQSETGDYQRWEVSYPSGDLAVTGILLVPDGEGPFPAVVLNHGYIDRDTYWSGQGVPREQEHLAEQGFVVLHTDYRGHAGSDDTDEVDHRLRVGYVRDAVNAAIAVGNEDGVDPDRVGMVGRSMGGGVTLGAAVAHPEVIDAAVVYASVSSLYLDNFRRWDLPERPGSANEIFQEFGDPEENPEFYADLSPRTFFDRIAAADLPVQIHHGEVDDTCPVEWARATESSLLDAGVRTESHYYADEGHTFEADWQTSIERTVAFLEGNLGS